MLFQEAGTLFHRTTGHSLQSHLSFGSDSSMSLVGGPGILVCHPTPKTGASDV